MTDLLKNLKEVFNNRKRILHIDDEPSETVLLEQLLEHAGLNIEIDSATSYELAKDQLRRNGYDLVILDLRIPGLLPEKTISTIGKLVHVPLVILTGTKDPKLLKPAETAADAVIHKTDYTTYATKIKEILYGTTEK